MEIVNIKKTDNNGTLEKTVSVDLWGLGITILMLSLFVPSIVKVKHVHKQG